MSWRDLLDLRTVVLNRGSRVVCRAPTVRTILLLLAHGAKEIHALRRAVGEGVDPERAARTVVEMQPEKAAHLLATCCTVEGVPRDETEGALAASPALILAAFGGVLSACDAPSIAAAMGLGPLTDDAQAEDATGAAAEDRSEAAIVAVAYAFGKAPHEIMDWPYEAFVSSMAVLVRMGVLGSGKVRQRGAEAAPYLTADNAPAGVTVMGPN